ncbi:hypothetical protein [Nocardioides sp. LML1-1-1.1]|uniref:hypothetical protein n=1 Tax=Nocardioides sp. LML1-1-1.1 TaxID=3135248 RepID=UPI0034208457
MVLYLSLAGASSADKGPWWFAGAVGLAGILLGLLIKTVVEVFRQRSRDRRDDRLRFIQDKRVAYADFLAACTEVADIEHENRLLAARRRRLDDADSWDDEDVREYNADRERIRGRQDEGYVAVTRAHSVLELIAPRDVVAAADLVQSRCHHPHLFPSRVAAERAYIAAVRSELGYPSTNDLPYTTAEPYIDYDSADSGIEPTEWTTAPH